MVISSIFSFPHNVFKRLFFFTIFKKPDCVVKVNKMGKLEILQNQKHFQTTFTMWLKQKSRSFKGQRMLLLKKGGDKNLVRGIFTVFLNVFSKHSSFGVFNPLPHKPELTLSQTTNFGLFQTERVSRRQFQI